MKNKILVLSCSHAPRCRSALRPRRERFLAAVQRLAPADPLLQAAAQRVPEERIEVVPDISAVHFVVAFYHLVPQPGNTHASASSGPHP